MLKQKQDESQSQYFHEEYSQQFSKTIESILKNNQQHHLQTKQILNYREIDSFHEYYNSRYNKLNAKYQKICQINAYNINKLQEYQLKFKQYQSAILVANLQVQTLEKQICQLTGKTTIKKNSLIHQLQIGEDSQNQFNKNYDQIRNSYEGNQPSQRKTVIKRYKHPFQATSKKYLIKEKQNTMENSLKNSIQEKILTERQQLQSQYKQMSQQNEMLRKRIKHEQMSNKYEDQRLKNATISLELDNKFKNQQIERLNQRIIVYEQKLNQILIKPERLSIKIRPKEKKIIGIEKQKQDDLTLKSYNKLKQDKQVGSSTKTEESQINCTNMVKQMYKQKHKRIFSSNLEDYQYEKQHAQLNQIGLKVKIIKFKKKNRS